MIDILQHTTIEVKNDTIFNDVTDFPFSFLMLNYMDL